MKHLIISVILAITLALPTYYQDMTPARSGKDKNHEFRISLVMQQHVLQNSN